MPTDDCIKTYPWKRFWRTTSGQLTLGDRGYLSDPEGEYGELLNPDVSAITGYLDKPFLAMLGEPGAGKSHEIRSAFEKAKQAADHYDIVKLFKLGECDSRKTLIDEVFDNPGLALWRKGFGVYTLFLDGLDEGLLGVKNLTAMIAGQMDQLEAFSDRLRIRVGCRTSDWGNAIQDSAERLWQTNGRVQILELAPLRYCDVGLAASGNGLPSDQFLSEVDRLDLQAFAMTPITLQFLLSVFRQHGSLPSSKVELYELGCRHLVTERNVTRRDAKQIGDYSPDQRMEVAGRIAYFLIFGGATTVSANTRPVAGTTPLNASEVAGRIELVRGDRFAVQEATVREALSTSLFHGRSEKTFAFRHQTYLEFMAARYLVRSGMTTRKIASLLFHPEEKAKIIPQFSEVAAWVAAQHKEVRDLVSEHDPQILLQSDLPRQDAGFREMLVEQLIAGLQSEELDDREWMFRGLYERLEHPNLDKQLKPILIGANQKRSVRRFACHVAEQCRVSSLGEALLGITLDASIDTETRHHAARAFVASSPSDADVVRLKPLAESKVGEDEEDELKGVALALLWSRRLIDTEELFESLITEPRTTSYGGEYSQFLLEELVESLSLSELPVAMRWVRENLNYCNKAHSFHYLIKGIVSRCLQFLDNESVLLELAKAISESFPLHVELPWKGSAFQELTKTDRRRIAISAAGQIADAVDAFYSFHKISLRWLDRDDLEWLIARINDEAKATERPMLAQLLRQVYRQNGQPCPDSLIQCSIDHPEVAEVFRPYFGPILIDSPEAAELCRSYRTEQRLLAEEVAINRGRDARIARMIPADIQISECLDRYEAGNNDSWWHCIRAMSIDGEALVSQGEHADDLTQYPGWIHADETTRTRMLDAARRYLDSWEPVTDRWLGGGIDFHPDRAAYQSLVLLDTLDQPSVNRLSKFIWEKLPAVVLCFPTIENTDNESFVRQKRLVAEVYAHAPVKLISVIDEYIEKQNHRNSRSNLGALNRLSDCWDDRIRRTLLMRIKTNSSHRRVAPRRPRLHAPSSRLRKRESVSTVGKKRPRVRKPPQSIAFRLKRRRLFPQIAGRLLEILIESGCHDSVLFAKELVLGIRYQPELAEHAALALWLGTDDHELDTLIRVFRKNRVLARKVLPKLASTVRNRTAKTNKSLVEKQIANVYRLLFDLYPYADDPPTEGAHNVTDRHAVARFRDRFLERLRNFGTRASCEQLERLAILLPQLEFLRFYARDAKRNYLKTSWAPTSIEDLMKLRFDGRSRFVRS